MTTVYATPSGQLPSLSSSSSNANANSRNSGGSGFWGSPGKVAGTFVAVGVVVFCLALLGFILWYRRRRRNEEDFEKRYNDVTAPAGSNTSIDPASAGSHAAFVYADEKGIEVPPTPVEKKETFTRLSQPASFTDNESGIPQDEGPVVVDQRLDPRQMFMHWENEGSKTSLADDVDYSRRVLRVINE
ncbi:WSC domain-containing protein [Lachancea thermotolerans]